MVACSTPSGRKGGRKEGKEGGRKGRRETERAMGGRRECKINYIGHAKVKRKNNTNASLPL